VLEHGVNSAFTSRGSLNGHGVKAPQGLGGNLQPKLHPESRPIAPRVSSRLKPGVMPGGALDYVDRRMQLEAAEVALERRTLDDAIEEYKVRVVASLHAWA
jgi:hypothetical protein